MKLFALFFFVLLACSMVTVSARMCGVSLFRQLFEICPSGCNVEDPLLASKLCAFSFNKEEMRALCCPDE